jgi:DNA polymerase-3 subunit gamma/tau
LDLNQPQDLALKYRPKSFDEILGQKSVVASLKNLIEINHKLPPCILFSGPSGTGKTSIARICASVVGCTTQNIIEIDAASYSSVENVRLLTDQMRFSPLGSKSRVVILDEVHRLSKQAFDALLKNIEEPPEGSSWIFCSTEPDKLPSTIKTRAQHYRLEKVPIADILGRLHEICASEEISLDKKILQYITVKAAGSPRQAIKFLTTARACTDLEQAQLLIKQEAEASEKTPIGALCRALLNRNSGAAFDAIKELYTDDIDAEGIRLAVVSYMSKVALNTEHTNDRFISAVQIILAFKGPFINSEKLAPIILATVRYLE